MEEKYISNSLNETLEIASNFAKTLTMGQIVLLSGDLGAGKTAFTKGVVRGLGLKMDEVVSPTFTIMNEYGGGKVLHYDLYRINSVEEFEATGSFEMLYSDAIKVVEWPEVIGLNYFPKESVVVEIKKLDSNSREILIKRGM